MIKNRVTIPYYLALSLLISFKTIAGMMPQEFPNRFDETDAYVTRDKDGNLILVDPVAAAVIQAVDNYNEGLRIKKLVELAGPHMKPQDVPILSQHFTLEDLHCAARAGNVEKVAELLTAGVPIDSQVDAGYTALHFAARYGHTAVIKLLLDRGANILLKSKTGRNVLHFASSYYASKQLMAILLDRHPHINSGDNNANTPLHCAALNGDHIITQLLLARGAGRQMQNGNGNTPLDLALINEQRPVDLSLLNAQCNFKATIQLLRGYVAPILVAALPIPLPMPEKIFEIKEEKKEPLECSICLELIPESQIQFLSCTHNFHKVCVKEWLEGSHTCPVCRHEEKDVK